MKKDKMLIYGAAGYMGKLFTRYAQLNQLPLILGSRDNFSTNLPVRFFALENETEVIDNLQDIQLVINLAGPFVNTNKSLVNACMKTGTHYIDIAGEVPDFQTVYEFDKVAKEAGIMLMPGAGFGVVPTDIVANLAKEKLPDATHLKIAYNTIGGASRGTLKTVLKDIHKEGVILRKGRFEPAMPAFKSFSFEAEGKNWNLVYNPWRADLFTAQLSTNISNIETYSNFPNFIVQMMKGKWLWLRDFLLNRLIHFLPEGPSEKQLKEGKTICYAEVWNEKGEKASATLIGPEAYLFTAQALLAISKNILAGNLKVGFQTPNLYGKALLKGISGTKII